MTYVADARRYESVPYRRCGRSGILLPEVSLGLWHNFGDGRPIETQRARLGGLPGLRSFAFWAVRLKRLSRSSARNLL
jgi:hypothetical protein